MKEIYDFAVKLAEEAGKITLKYFRTDLRVDSKPDLSPVTIADRQAEEFLRKEIEKRFPDDGILGEEFGEKPGKSGYRWILDPIDGTKTFIRGVPMYGTMIAVERDGESLIGVIRFPPSNETIAALSGYGCFFNGARCKGSSTASLAQATVLTTAMDGILKYRGEKTLLRLLRETGIQRTWGDCYGYMLVATGRADAMIDPIVHLWDVAPIKPIIVEAGGRFSDADGNDSTGVTNMVGSNGLVHDGILNILRS